MNGLYSAADVIGKTLILKEDAPVLDKKPEQGGVVVGTAKTGVSIVVDSWAVNNATGDLYWTFWTGYPKQYRFILHTPNRFGYKTLQDQGVMTEVEKAAAEAAKNKSLSDKAFDFLKYGVLIFAGVSILNTVIKNK